MQAKRARDTSKARSAALSALVEAGRLLPLPQQWEGAQKRRNNSYLVGWKEGEVLSESFLGMVSPDWVKGEEYGSYRKKGARALF